MAIKRKDGVSKVTDQEQETDLALVIIYFSNFAIHCKRKIFLRAQDLTCHFCTCS